MFTVECDGVKVVHTSDVQGPISNEALRMLIEEQPDLISVGGPPLYLSNYRIRRKILEHGLLNIGKLVEKIPMVIVDHHLLRAQDWKKASNIVFETASRTGHQIMTAAGFIGKSDNILESC